MDSVIRQNLKPKGEEFKEKEPVEKKKGYRYILLRVLILLFLVVAGVAAFFYFSPAGSIFDFFQKDEAAIEENLIYLTEESLEIPEEKVVESVVLLFFGDLMFDRKIRQTAAKNGNDFIFRELKDLLNSVDLAVANLEGPITANRSVSLGSNPNESRNFIFTFDSSLAETLSEHNIKIVNLGNNHILNFGSEGLEETKKYLAEGGVEYFGDPLATTTSSIIESVGGLKIGLVNYNQFAGSQALEKTLKEIKEVRPVANLLIVYAHWGAEYAKQPSSAIKKIAQALVDGGADLIIGSHPHVVQEKQEYRGKMIYYSLGNFIFDQYFNEEVRKGLAVRVRINPETRQMEFEETPVYLEKNGQTMIGEL